MASKCGSLVSPSVSGPARLSIDLYACASGPTNWSGGEADVRVRVLDFGAAGAPATVSVVIRRETRPPTGTTSQTVRTPGVRQTATLVAVKDVVLYEDLASGSNGRGQFLWAARRTDSIFSDTTVSSTGLQSFSSPALLAAVQSMVSTGTGLDGFLLEGPLASPFAFAQSGLQIASRENPGGTTSPTLVVEYYPTEVYESGQIHAGTISFIDAAQSFRWIYDLDQDGVFVTPIVGICEATGPNPSNPNLLPYTYRYQGAPGFTGVDCCTWRVSSSLGIAGTGQALFFHRLDPANPANQPPDGDLDGIRDRCDDCPNHANGPLRGSCLAGTVGAICRSNLECGTGGVCSLPQEDPDGGFVGNACVPEPGLGGGIAAGLLALIALARGAVASAAARC